MVIRHGEPDTNLSSGRRELQRISDEIGDDLLHPLRVDGNRRIIGGVRFHTKRHAPLLEGGMEGLCRLSDDLEERCRAPLYLQFSGLQPGDLEQVLNEAPLTLKAVLDLLRRLTLLGRGIFGGEQKLRPAKSGRHRRPQLMRDHRQKAILATICDLGLTPELRFPFEQKLPLLLRAVTLKSNRDEMGDRLDQLQIFLVESISAPAAYGEGANQLIVHEQRKACVRSDPERTDQFRHRIAASLHSLDDHAGTCESHGSANGDTQIELRENLLGFRRSPVAASKNHPAGARGQNVIEVRVDLDDARQLSE